MSLISLGDVLEWGRAPHHGLAARQLLECHWRSFLSEGDVAEYEPLGAVRPVSRRQCYSATDSVPRWNDRPREAADAVRDGARLGARVPRHDGRDRGAAADGGGPRARPQRSAVGLPGLPLSLSAFYLVGGAIGDRVGLRRTFIVGVILFALASLLTALAPSEGVLIGGRALQGVVGAVLTTTSLALLRIWTARRAGDRPGPPSRALRRWAGRRSAASSCRRSRGAGSS